MKNSLALLALGALGASAHATDLNGSDWTFAYQGHYALASADVSGLGLTSVVGAALTAQLALLNGAVSAAGPTTLSQSSAANLVAGPLTFDAQESALLLPAVRSFLYDALSANDGLYSGLVSGSTLSLTKQPDLAAAVDGLGILDTRVAGVGVVIDLRAAVPTNTLTGTIDGLNAGNSLPFGVRGTHVTGTAGLMDTLALQARATTYTLGLGGITSSSTGYVAVGAVQTTADSWSLSRANVQATPEPASLVALGVGSFGLLRRRRRSA